jgi:uncharacterized protein YndB with AHSA1/START domain
MTFPTSEFTLERSFALPQDALWHILTDPKEREAWGTPDESMVLTVEKADLREDGHERHRCGPAEAPEFTVDTRWYRLEAPRAACFTESLTFQGMRTFTSLVTYRLATEGTGSKLEVHVAVTSFDDETVFAEVEGGWTSALDRLQARLVSA